MAYLEKLYEMDLKDFDLRRLGVALSWRWERERDYEFEVLIGVELFAPIYEALYQLGLNLDYDARWAIWAVYTEGLRRAGMGSSADPQPIEVKPRSISAGECAKNIRPQINLIIKGMKR